MWVVLRVVDVFKPVPCVRVRSVHLTREEAMQVADPDDKVIELC